MHDNRPVAGSPTPISRWEQLQRDAGIRLAGRLFQDLASELEDPSPSHSRGYPSLSLGIAIAVATLAYATAFAFALAGVWLLAGPWTHFLIPVMGVVLVLLSWATRPRPVKPPPNLVPEHDYPVIHELCRRIANTLGAPPLTAIALSSDFGANYRAAGWRMQNFLELGSPLLAVLNREERIAVLAHELSHGANDDPLRGRYLFGAVSMLSTWAVAIRPLRTYP